ncbi:AbiH family protein [Zunongwangia sp. F260]|uniref:AbiH family protein n=1 Tax=Autumnicola lenta TaxID=3075593 RepID=A0ABU3CJ06_9FLAO|nr:AbiH family protein [Zunongwangia sp. F260]MDT0646341.1 AbiH family protein [Zunongwangia sp. F260]
MNRLILLGNGFDLAHGLKTSYKDFIIDLVKAEIYASLHECDWDNYTEKGTYKNGPITIVIDGHRRRDEAELGKIETFDELKLFTKRYSIKVYGSPGNGIFHKTYSDLTSYNWADIESIYYEILSSILEKNSSRKLKEGYKRQVIDLNKELDFLRERLVDYLNKVQSVPTVLEPSMIKGFWERVCGRHKGSIPGNIQILNFNYTDTVANYGELLNISKARGMEIDVNHIHGKLTEPASVIFGYGDEVDSYYKQMEDLNDNELLRHAKSFGYFKNSNYKRLLGFIDSGHFEVWVVGHSCGLSDRVMLKKIFEHPNCRVITIHHFINREVNDHTEKTYQISRHFDNKELMRERIEPFDPKNCISEWIG